MKSLLVIGAPLLLALLEVFHPHPHDLLALDFHRWLLVHYAQIVLFPLAALAMAGLVHGQTGVAAVVCRVAMFVFAVSYVAFDTAAGVVTGVLVEAAHRSSAPEAWRAALDTIWTHPIIGSTPPDSPPLLGALGSVAWSVGAVATAISLKRSGASWLPVLLLAVSSFGIGVFKTHAWPGGPITFGGLGLAAVIIMRLRRSGGTWLPKETVP
jgi:hypothetical protein